MSPANDRPVIDRHCPIVQVSNATEYEQVSGRRIAQSVTDVSSPKMPGHVLFIIDQLKKPFGGAEQMLLKITRNLPRERFRSSVLTFATDLTTDELSSFPCPLYVFPLTRSYDLNAARMAIRLTRLVHSENVQIVHSFFETSDLWGGTIVRLTSKAKLVSSRRDMGILRSAKHRVAYRVLGPLVHKVLTVSEEVRRFVLATDHLPPGKVVTLYNGLEAFDPVSVDVALATRRRLGFSATARLITAVGNIRRVKGFDVLIRAAAEVCASTQEANFIVAGDILETDHYDELLHLIENFGLRKRFRFIGHQSDVFPVLCASDLFVLPSRSEGFSNALLEAMAVGLPCIATRVGGNAEAVQDGKTGLLIEPEDPSAIADSIYRLIRNPRKANEMGSAAKKRAIENFSLESMIQKLSTVYDDLLYGSS